MRMTQGYEYDHTTWKGCVYFIEDRTGLCFVKIGFTSGKPEIRMKQLQTANPTKLRLIGVITDFDGKSGQEVESELHEKYKEYRQEGEWFQFIGENGENKSLEIFRELGLFDNDDDNEKDDSGRLEYKVILAKNPQELQRELNTFGRHGWKLKTSNLSEVFYKNPEGIDCFLASFYAVMEKERE